MRRLNNRCKDVGKKPRALFLDMAYTLKLCKERELEQEFASRSCGGYFGHVWGVHPIADIPEKRKLNYDGFKLSVVEFSRDQTIIEGLSAYFSVLKYCFPLNFFVKKPAPTQSLWKTIK